MPFYGAVVRKPWKINGDLELQLLCYKAKISLEVLLRSTTNWPHRDRVWVAIANGT